MATGIINQNNASGIVVEQIASTDAIGDTTHITNDGVYQLSIIIAGVLVRFFESQTVDPILKLGALTHLVEVLGNLTVDGNTTLSGSLTVGGTTTLTGLLAAVNASLSGSLNVTGVLTATNAGNTFNTSTTRIPNTASNLPGARLSKAVLGDLLAWGASDITLSCSATGGSLLFKDSNGTTWFNYQGVQTGTFIISNGVSVTVNHSIGVTPTTFWANSTIGAYNAVTVTSTTLTISGANSSGGWIVIA